MDKLPHHIPTMFRRIRKAVEPFPKAAMFELAERGYGTLFQQLVACVISIRTRDEERVVGHLGPDLLGPDWDPADWRVASREAHPADARHAHAFAFVDYVRAG